MSGDALGQKALELFNHKASGWGAKYGPSGPLRERLLRFCAALRLRVAPPARVFELGCGAGDLAAALASQGYGVQAADVSERMLEQAQSRFGNASVRWLGLSQDWKTLPGESGSFDAVVASSVLEYVDDVVGVLSECSRLLRPHGVVLATVPNVHHWARRIEAFAHAGFHATTLGRLAERIPRIGGYVRYLEVSQNRFALQTWREMFARANCPLESAVAEDETLTLLVGHKGGTIAGAP